MPYVSETGQVLFLAIEVEEVERRHKSQVDAYYRAIAQLEERLTTSERRRDMLLVETCNHCGALPFEAPFPSGKEPPVVRGALDAQAEAEKKFYAERNAHKITKRLVSLLSATLIGEVSPTRCEACEILGECGACADRRERIETVLAEVPKDLR